MKNNAIFRMGALSRPRSAILWLQLLLISVLAFTPRIISLNDFYTIDEAYHWPGRVERFSTALGQHHWAETNQTGHPGVTTMWLGALGRQLAFTTGVSDPGWAGGGAGYLAMLRLPLACVNALAVVLGFVLLRSLLADELALLAGILWASSPFLIAHSRILHLDALLTSFMTLSILALLVSMRLGTDNAGRQEIQAQTFEVLSLSSFQLFTFFLSAVCAGLALITKAPALILLPFVGILLYVWQLSFWRRRADRQRRSWLFMAHATCLLMYVCWLCIAVLTAWLLWPAMWIDPLNSVRSVVYEIMNNGGQPHDAGNYFLGQALPDPGPLFYPAVMLLRSTPLSTIGLLLTLAMFGWQLYHRKIALPYALIVLLAFCVVFTIVMSMEAKKLDRYLLPLWPALEILAAYGLWSIWQALQRFFLKFYSIRTVPNIVTAGLFSAVLLLQCWQLFSYAPYYMAYYNPLVGGGPVAEYVMMVGLGEGMDQVGAWLRDRPDLERGDVLSWIPPTLAPFVPKQVLVRDLRTEFLDRPSSYAVLYIRSVQHKENAIAEARVRQNPVLHTIQLYGISYATIHQLPRPFDTALDVEFDHNLALLGFSQQHIDSTLVITASWSIEQDRPGGVMTFVHVIDQTGQIVAQVDEPLDQGMFQYWQAGQKFDSALPLTLPAGRDLSACRIVLGVYDYAGTRLPITHGIALPTEIDGPQVIELLARDRSQQ